MERKYGHAAPLFKRMRYELPLPKHELIKLKPVAERGKWSGRQVCPGMFRMHLTVINSRNWLRVSQIDLFESEMISGAAVIHHRSNFAIIKAI
jgi:hypothetical protein